MKANKKHYKFINSETGNAIFYHSLEAGLKEDDIKAELEKVKAQVAIQNGLYIDIVYWEEDKDKK
jgi:hypothetical protein